MQHIVSLIVRKDSLRCWCYWSLIRLGILGGMVVLRRDTHVVLIRIAILRQEVISHGSRARVGLSSNEWSRLVGQPGKP
jgi:hypothetical protein